MNYPTFKYKDLEWHYGEPNLPLKIWREVDLINDAEAKSLLPDWINQFIVNEWYPNHDNDPDMGFICNISPSEYTHDISDQNPEWGFVQEGHYYRSRHSDGRLIQYYHGSKLTWDSETNRWHSDKQRGFAGREVQITINPSKIAKSDPKFHDFNSRFLEGKGDISLHGPWSVGFPRGYYAANYKIIGDKYDLWYHGLGVTKQLVCTAASAFFPESSLRLFEVVHFTIQNGEHKTRYVTLEPFSEEQKVPKSVNTDIRIRKAQSRPLHEIKWIPNTWTQMKNVEDY